MNLVEINFPFERINVNRHITPDIKFNMTACICKNAVLHLSAEFKIIKMNVANTKRINNSGKFKVSHKTLRNAHEH